MTDEHRSSGPTADDFTRDLIAWQNQVLADRGLTLLAFHVAFVIGQHVNRESGLAWPSQERIAEHLSVTPRGVRNAVDQLATRGHLQVAIRHGRGDSNHYRPVLKNRNGGSCIEPENRNGHSGKAEENRNGGSANGAEYRNGGSSLSAGNRNHGSYETGTTVPPNYLNEPSEEEESISPKPASKPKRSRAKPSTSDEEFASFWLQFPRRVGKAAARNAYDRAITSGDVTHAELMASVMRYAAERTGQDPKFTKHPANWVRAGCWADEPEATVKPDVGYRRPGTFSALDYAIEEIERMDHE